MEKSFSLTYSDPWRMYDSFTGVSCLIWALHSFLRKVRGWATVPIVTQRSGRQVSPEEVGYSGISLNTRSYIIVNSYSRWKDFRIDISCKEGIEIDPEEVIAYLKSILPGMCKLKERNPKPDPDEIA